MLFNVLYYILYALSIIGIFAVALLVYSRRKEEEYKNFAIFAAFLNIWLIFQFFAQLFAGEGSMDATYLLRASVATGPFFAIYFFFFATRYVGVRTKKAKHFLLPIIAAIFTVGTSLVVESASASIDGIVLQDGILYYVVTGLVVGYVLVGLGYIIKRGSKPSARGTALSRRQANKVMIYGVLQAIVIISIATTVFVEESFAQVLIPFALFLMVIIFGYAMVRHRLFDIRFIVVRALGYSLSIVTIGAIYAILAFGLVNTLVSSDNDFLQQILYLAIASVLALTFTPLKRFFDTITRSIFYQDAYESQKVIDEFNTTLVSTVDIKDLAKSATEILRRAIKSEYVGVLLAPEGDKKLGERLIVSGKNTIVGGEKLYKTLSQHDENLLIQDVVYEENKDLYRHMASANCAVAARLKTHDEFIGYVLFGAKSNGRAYTSQDIELIRITVDELSLGIQNTLRFEEIRMFNQTLQEKVNDATAQLRRTNSELRRLDEAKDEFLSMASHQLRTPLTSVKGYLSMVLEGDVGRITTTQKQLLSEAFTSSERMVHLINDFLNVSRLQTGKFMLEVKDINLAKVVGQEVDSLQTTAGAHSMRLEYHMPSHFPILYVDENKIRQVVMNFIDNAIYYSKEDSTITISLGIEEANVVLKVHDTGIGVPEEEQAHIFTKFFRATNARKQRPDGTGVGLFLAKKVIVAHGGSMVFESKEGEGSTFGFRLPVKKLSEAPRDDTDKLDN